MLDGTKRRPASDGDDGNGREIVYFMTLMEYIHFSEVKSTDTLEKRFWLIRVPHNTTLYVLQTRSMAVTLIT
jgi:hypothetical protein